MLKANQIVAQGQIKGVTTINISSLVNGIYIVHISKNNLPVEVRKFVKQ